jgi:hypothetical protein
MKHLHTALVGWLVAGLSLLAGCGVDPAPKELSNLSKWFWVHYDDASDEELAEGIENLHNASKSVTADEPLKGTVARLGKSDLEVINFQNREPKRARGYLVITEFPCKLAQLEKIVIALNQPELHPDTYKKYKREYTSDLAKYLARDTSQLKWKVDLTTDPTIGSAATENLNGGSRFIKSIDSEVTPHGAFLISRTWLTAPATFEDDGYALNQDYQIETWHERKPGRILHMFTVWRQGQFDVLDTEDDTFGTLMMNAFVDWDERVAELCKAGIPK